MTRGLCHVAWPVPYSVVSCITSSCQKWKPATPSSIRNGKSTSHAAAQCFCYNYYDYVGTITGHKLFRLLYHESCLAQAWRWIGRVDVLFQDEGSPDNWGPGLSSLGFPSAWISLGCVNQSKWKGLSKVPSAPRDPHPKASLPLLIGRVVSRIRLCWDLCLESRVSCQYGCVPCVRAWEPAISSK